MIFILVNPEHDECNIFKSRQGMSLWIHKHFLDEDELGDWFYFKVPDDFCIPVKYLDNTSYISGAIHNMGYQTYRVTGDE
jgi:hypothetical protein